MLIKSATTGVSIAWESLSIKYVIAVSNVSENTIHSKISEVIIYEELNLLNLSWWNLYPRASKKNF